MNSRPRQAVKSFRPVRAAFFRMPVKSGRAGTGYEATLSLLKYIEAELEMVKKFVTFVIDAVRYTVNYFANIIKMIIYCKYWLLKMIIFFILWLICRGLEKSIKLSNAILLRCLGFHNRMFPRLNEDFVL